MFIPIRFSKIHPKGQGIYFLLVTSYHGMKPLSRRKFGVLSHFMTKGKIPCHITLVQNKLFTAEPPRTQRGYFFI
jgi:hypothetical protein